MDGGTLSYVGLAPGSFEASDGLVSVIQPIAGLPVDEAALIRRCQQFAVENDGERVHAIDYVFFRRFGDGRTSQPAAFVIDNTTERFTGDELAQLHHALWLDGVAPLIYIGWPSRIDILSCARGPDFWDDGSRHYSPAVQLEVAAAVDEALELRRRVSARRLADGTFWEEPLNQPLANHEKAAHESLIRAVVETDTALDGDANPVARRLLLLTVLIKYLEDRRVFRDAGWFGRFRPGARSFLDVLNGEEPEEVLALLRALERKFNGDVFRLPDEMRLTKTALRRFASLVEAKTLGDQRYLWELYAFDHIPVEVISHLYQRFVKGSTAVYTPPFLAALLLDHAMPYDKLTGRERVLDPACGSGVFLVGAYRRLANAWRARNNWRTPRVDTLKAILRNQIFGVELERDAIDLTAFSLALALCDSLQPNVIWNELRFDRLSGTNLLEVDFFDASVPDNGATAALEGPFELIVGNPPFESKFSEAAKRANTARLAEHGGIPDKQVAYLFLDQCIRMRSQNGRICLIQPSSFLYNFQSHAFRSFITSTRQIDAVFDFTSVRGLYDGADPKTVAVLIGANKAAQFSHWTFRRTFRTAQKISFELDHYDRHQLYVDEIVEDPKAARANLLGGGRLTALLSRFREMRTLADFIDSRGWLMGEGFTEGLHGKQLGVHLTGKRLLPTSALTTVGFEPEELARVSATHFVRARRPDLFEAPLVLIRENETLPIAFWDDGPLTYKHEIVGIHAPESDRPQLQMLFDELQQNHHVLRFAVIANSPRMLVAKATAILKGDIESLPFPEDQSELKLNFWEQVLVDDTLTYFAPYVRLGDRSTLLKNAADENVLLEYSSLYCRMLGSLYDNLRAGDPVFLNGLICQPFFFGDAPGTEWMGPDCEEQLAKLVFEEMLPSLRTVRVVRFYDENVVFIIKPDRLRYWIRSTAIRDADDTLTELRQQGF